MRAIGTRAPGSPFDRSTTQALAASGRKARTTRPGLPSTVASCGPRTPNGSQWAAWTIRSMSAGLIVGDGDVFWGVGGLVVVVAIVSGSGRGGGAAVGQGRRHNYPGRRADCNRRAPLKGRGR